MQMECNGSTAVAQVVEGLTLTYEGHWSYPGLLVLLPVGKWVNAI